MITETKPFCIAASYTIGSHILPGIFMDDIQNIVEGKLTLSILQYNEIIDGIKNEKFDLGIIESPLFDSSLLYKEWIEDELVICSKKPLSPSLSKKEVSTCRLICRKEDSLTRNFIASSLSDIGLSYQSFKSLSEIGNTTAMIQSVKWAKPNIENPTITIISQHAIEDELKYKELYQSRICNKPMIRKFHIIYDKQKVSDSTFKDVLAYLLTVKSVFPISDWEQEIYCY